MSTLNVGSINSGPIGGFRNALINGNPTINQRGYVSGAATSGANEYTLDRWRVVVSGENISWTDSENVRTATAPAGGVEQVVEGINLISGSYVLSWTGTATATINGSSVSSGSPVTLTGGTNATVRFSNGTFALAQLEPGTRATPFERRSYGQELALCQRYFELVKTGCGVYTTTKAYVAIQSNVTKRATPTIAAPAVLNTSDIIGADFTQTSVGIAVSANTDNGCIVEIQNISGSTSGRVAVFSPTNSNFIQASAEL